MDLIKDVTDFFCKIGFEYNGPPRTLPADLVEFRTGCMDEETAEYREAIAADDKAKQLDALIDLIYFAVGNLVISGYPFEEAWNRVHAANMQKISGKTKRDHFFDAIKPEGWTPPDLTDLVDHEPDDFGAIQ